MIADILPRLEKAKQTGRNNWLACCPAHDDHSPSMTMHETDDGRILVRCWTGCTFEEIVNAVGMGWEPWFPPKQDSDFKKPVRRPYPAADVLAAVADDVMHIAVFVANLGRKCEPAIEPEDYLNMLRATGRIVEARRIALG